VAVLEMLGRLVSFLGGAGPVLFGIVALVAAPFVDRLVIRRKRIGYRVLYNSKLGLGPEMLHRGDDSVGIGSPQLRQIMRVLDRMSIVVIRISNSGSYDIEPGDFEEPLSFTFGGRVVWNARISGASTEQLRRQLRESLRFFPTQALATASPAARDNLVAVRGRLTERMMRWLGPPPARTLEPEQGSLEPRWHGVRMDGLSLGRRQTAKLVVVLREPANNRGELTKEVRMAGKLKDAGLIEDDARKRLVNLPRLTVATAGLLTVVLVLGLLARPAPSDPTVACSRGELRIEGSSVFMPTLQQISEDYVGLCGGRPSLPTDPSGSIDGVRRVVESDPAQPPGILALSDGTNKDHHNQLYSERVAIVVYHVVVNSSVGLTTLSMEDLRRIHDGRYRDWNQLPGGGPSLPIRIIGRGQNSGSRQLFEQKVLDTNEGVLSSNECYDRDRDPKAPIIRCERDSNSEIIQKLSTIPGAIGYADASSIAHARRTNDLVALTLDGKAFDTSTAVESGYSFWTVEYLYLKRSPEPGSLAANFVEFVRKHERARARLTDDGYLPCTTPEGLLELCNLR
jgi:phosphate transport system substrate-binding protein